MRIYATISEAMIEKIRTATAEIWLTPILPNQTFMPRKDEIKVGTEITIVAPAKNFMTLLRLLEIIVP